MWWPSIFRKKLPTSSRIRPILVNLGSFARGAAKRAYPHVSFSRSLSLSGMLMLRFATQS